MLDTIQVPFFFHLHGAILKSRLMQKLKRRNRHKVNKNRRTLLFKRLQILGLPGVVMIALLPLRGCGMLSAFVLAQLLQLKKHVTYLLLICGSLLGCALILGLAEMVLSIWRVLRT